MEEEEHRIESPIPVKELKKNIKNWIAQNNAFFKYNFVEPNGSENVTYSSHSLKLTGPSLHIGVVFTRDISPQDTLQTIRQAISYISVNFLPMPGFDIPPPWKLSPRTPVSPVHKGIEVTEYANGRILIVLNTKFYAVYGSLPGRWGGCGKLPKGTYVCVRKPMKTTIQLDLPLPLPPLATQQ
eukprot:TRINITY_DN11022_c0_g1_i1.p1 TRINITY_DN11022_c0_g1~~TRINITY_DN11022_c0_g1_i1.p1  ORF type:complete len:183 (-),score=48.70 TRINITY_DN11022_c0_g1_i1:14-562(-)